MDRWTVEASLMNARLVIFLVLVSIPFLFAFSLQATNIASPWVHRSACKSGESQPKPFCSLGASRRSQILRITLCTLRESSTPQPTHSLHFCAAGTIASTTLAVTWSRCAQRGLQFHSTLVTQAQTLIGVQDGFPFAVSRLSRQAACWACACTSVGTSDSQFSVQTIRSNKLKRILSHRHGLTSAEHSNPRRRQNTRTTTIQPANSFRLLPSARCRFTHRVARQRA